MEKLVTISRDPFARVDTVRRPAPSSFMFCPNCERSARWQYGEQPDSISGRVNWDARAFCSIGCRRSYNG